MFSPLEQFEILPIFSFITNQSLTIILGLFGIIVLFLASSTSGFIMYNGWNRLVVDGLHFVYSMVKEQIGDKEYFGVILTIFLSILIFNLMGLVPYSFTATSHTLITFGLSVPVFLTITGEAIYRHGFNFFSYFSPAGSPIGLVPLLAGIEVISYLARVISLSVRLNANLLAGHVLIHIIALSVASLLSVSVFLGILPFIGLVLLFMLEFAVAIIQAYVFTLLTCIYLREAIHLH